jgi:hypothetical protein
VLKWPLLKDLTAVVALPYLTMPASLLWDSSKNECAMYLGNVSQRHSSYLHALEMECVAHGAPRSTVCFFDHVVVIARRHVDFGQVWPFPFDCEIFRLPFGLDSGNGS